ncbi:MAG: alpha/beta fold hydrolase [Sandaracinaceae bacterium]|nr:alpha/beta fold hydrolase [Sandaracinaceae bacterium]
MRKGWGPRNVEAQTAATFVFGGRHLAYTDEGEGPTTLVAVHGAPGSGRDLRHLAALLSPELRVVRPDLAGFGSSPRWDGSHTARCRAEQVVALLDALELERVALLGYSMGGEVAAIVAEAHPARVSHLALLASIGPRPHRARRNLLVRGLGALLDVERLEPLLRASLRLILAVGGFPKRSGFDEIQETLRTLLGADFARHGERLARLEVPTLAAWCDDDQYIEPAVFEELVACCPPGPRLHFETGGHGLQKTRAEEIARGLSDWLRTPPSR